MCEVIVSVVQKMSNYSGHELSEEAATFKLVLILDTQFDPGNCIHLKILFTTRRASND